MDAITIGYSTRSLFLSKLLGAARADCSANSESSIYMLIRTVVFFLILILEIRIQSYNVVEPLLLFFENNYSSSILYFPLANPSGEQTLEFSISQDIYPRNSLASIIYIIYTQSPS